MSSLVGCLLLFLKIYVLKIGENYRGKYEGNRKIEISALAFEVPERTLICVGCSVHYWVSGAINKRCFFEIAFSSHPRRPRDR